MFDSSRFSRKYLFTGLLVALLALTLASCASPQASAGDPAAMPVAASPTGDAEPAAATADHEHDADTPADHSHEEAIEIAEGKTHPTVTLTVHEDPLMGWNLQVETVDFVFTPQNASGPDVLGEGHAHVYVDGEKLGRLYGNWYHIASLAPGIHEVTVSLNGNGHAPYVYAGQPVEALATVISPDPPPAEEMGGAYPMPESATDASTDAYPMAMDAEAGHEHEAEVDPHTHMNGEAIDIPEGKVHPTIELTVHEDPKMGWNFQVAVDNFTFSPQNASLENVLGEGHAHIYIDGDKLGRLYTEWFHIAALEPGTHEIRVSLNGNNHAPYYYAGMPVEAMVTVEVAE